MRNYPINILNAILADFSGDRLHNFEIIVSPDRPSQARQHYPESEVCARGTETFSGTRTFHCKKAMIGEYVVIRFTDREGRALTLCEVEVEGTKAKGEFTTTYSS